jgi:sugar phosphate permease
LELSKAQRRALFVVWLTYGCFYFCRVNIGPARSEIEKAFALDPLEMGLVLGALKIGYALGQLLSGQFSERFGPRRILLIGLFGSVSACFLFAFAGLADGLSFTGPVNAIVHVFSPSAQMGRIASLLFVIWFMNGVLQAGGWPPTVKIIAGWFTPTQRGRIMGIIGTSYQLGSAITIAGSGALVSIFGDWRAAFVVPALMLGAVGVHAYLRLQERPAPGDAPAVEALEPVTSAPSADRHSVKETLILTFTNPRIWILALALFGLDLVRYGFLDWAPGHLKKLHGSGVLLAGLKVAVFPLAGGLGALASGWATDRWFQSRRAPVIAATMMMVGLLTFLFDKVAPLGAGPTIVVLALIGFFLYGAQILLVGTAAQDFAKKGTTAAAAGFVDAMGSFGAFGGDVVTGWLLKHRDFHAAIMAWAIAAIAAGLLSVTLWRAKPVHA